MVQTSIPSETALSLAPLGAGDLIDRSIRLYRKHFLTLIRIAAPPILISAIGGVMWTIGWRKIFVTDSSLALFAYGVLVVAGLAFTWGGVFFQIIVMGGATRNLVTHLLWREPVSAMRTYKNVRSRFWGLALAAFLLGIATLIVLFIDFVILYFALIILALGSFAIAQVLPSWLMIIIVTIGAVFVSVVCLTILFFVMGKFAYVPQVMLVEGKGVFDAIGRSFVLSKGNVRRLMAMWLFSTMAAWSALMVLIVPLGLFAYVHSINPFFLDAKGVPIWYSIGYSVLTHVSSIVVAPIWMLGLSLLYVDERVRHEGYDIEILAARNLGEMPKLHPLTEQVYTPALAHPGGGSLEGQDAWSSSILGLK